MSKNMTAFQRPLRSIIAALSFFVVGTPTIVGFSLPRNSNVAAHINHRSNGLFLSGWLGTPPQVAIFRRRRQRNAPVEGSCCLNLSEDYVGDGDDPRDDSQFFDDFDFVVGENASSDNQADAYGVFTEGSGDTSSVLQDRFEQLETMEQAQKDQIRDNWKEGYWGVWGCSLDPYDFHTSTSSGEEQTRQPTPKKIVITSIRQMNDWNENLDSDSDDVILLVVGRSDGSICWLQMETLSSPSTSASTDNDATRSVENRSIYTSFENKLVVSKATSDGGMVVGTALQQSSDDETFGDDNTADSNANGHTNSPFEILAQIQTATVETKTTSTTSDAAAIVDMLSLPNARMLWTIAKGTPNHIQGWNLAPSGDDDEPGVLLPQESLLQADIDRVHDSPIVGMKVVPNTTGDTNRGRNTEWIASVAVSGQVFLWETTRGAARVRLDANLLHGTQGEEEINSGNPVLSPSSSSMVSSMDVDDQYLYLGTNDGRIVIFGLEDFLQKSHDYTEETASPPAAASLPLLQSFVGFANGDPGVSSLLAAGSGTLGGVNKSNSNYSSMRPPTKSLIAGSVMGELKQWDLIPAGTGRLEYWPRMTSQKLPGGKPHVYETPRAGSSANNDGDETASPAIRGLLCIQQVLLAATDHDLTVWDSMTGKALYDMRGLEFGPVRDDNEKVVALPRPNLVAAKDSILVTNGMEQLVCVHDFAMDRVTFGTSEENGDEDTNDYLEQL